MQIEKLELAPSDRLISYGDKIPALTTRQHLHLKAGNFFKIQNYLRRDQLNEVTESLSQTIDFDNTNQIIHEDIIANTFYLLSGYEEFVNLGSRDKRGRRTFKSYLDPWPDLVQKPTIDQYVNCLEKTLKKVMPTLQLKKWSWCDRKFAFAITRDIDSLHRYRTLTLNGVLASFVRLNTHTYLANSRLLHKNDPYDNLPEILAWEDKIGVRSSIYFMASQIIGDSDYSIKELARKPYMETMNKEGWEPGFHPGFRTYNCVETFRQEKHVLESALNVKLSGGRQHGLRFQNPYTWRLWEEEGFQYDSTVGFAEQEGFKAGTSYPYAPYDLIENRTMNLLEFPITLMDCTLDKYRGLDAGQREIVLENLLQQVENSGGIFVLLWHNTYFGERNIGTYHHQLVELVETAISKRAHICTLKEAAEITQKRFKTFGLIQTIEKS